MTKTLEAHDKLLKEIFSDNYQFEIPDYQRPYAWTTEQAEELFDDLRAAVQDDKQYFLGSIVLIKKDRDAKAQVVDGQQRLSTLTILFAALRAMIPDQSAKITRLLYNEGWDIVEETNQYRLRAREEDADFFRTYIQETGGILRLRDLAENLKDSRLRYKENATLLLQKIEALGEAERTDLLKFLVSNCSLVVVSTPDLDAAYRIFSVLNNRGLDLAPIDILKAQVLGAIRTQKGEAASHTYSRTWSRLESQLGRDAFGELFAHIRAIYAKKKQQATLVKEFEQYVTDYATPTALVDNVIAPYAEIWDFIRDNDFAATEHAETVNHYLESLNRIEFKDWVPPALVYFKRYRQKPALLAGFIQGLERLTYFLLVTRAGINERIDIYAELTRQIEATDNETAMPARLALSDSEQREFIAALDGNIYRKLPKGRMPLMLKLESLCSDGSKKQEYKHLSLEHVLPQTPAENSTWLEWFPEAESRESWTHRLANLVPLHLRKNPAASNYDFDHKKNVYFIGKEGKSSPFILTNEVRGESAWKPEVLEARQQRLLAKLTDHWALENRMRDAA